MKVCLLAKQVTLIDDNFAPYSGFTPGSLVFTHYTPVRQRDLPGDRSELKQNNIIKRVTEMD